MIFINFNTSLKMKKQKQNLKLFFQDNIRENPRTLSDLEFDNGFVAIMIHDWNDW